MKKKLIAKFSFTTTVLAINDTISWLEQRLKVEEVPNATRVIKFLKEMRDDCSDAVSSKPFRLD